MKKNNKGITMSSLILTIVLMSIIVGATISTSLNRFELNQLSKMYNDIELLADKVSNYYLKYGGLPIIRDAENNPILYSLEGLNFDKNINDNENYYILDLKAMEGLSLNYGEEGINNPTILAKDIYIVNESSHVIYYVQGIEVDGITYHTLSNDENSITDNIPPAKPEIKVVSGKSNKNGIYISEVRIEIVPGKDKWSGTNRTTYSINNEAEIDITTLTNNIYTISTDGEYTIKAKSYDQNGNVSQDAILELVINMSSIKISSDKLNVQFKENTSLIDKYENKITVPAGFKILVDNTTEYTTDTIDVTKGIVIEDVSAGTAETKGSQFVWIPIETIYTNEQQTENKVVSLSRYTFETDGKVTPYENKVIAKRYEELEQKAYENEIAKSITTFIKKSKENGGFYIGRYETRTNSSTERKKSSDLLTTATCIKENAIYNYINQQQASSLSQNMYSSNHFTSDLVNSYAWDTALAFFQQFDKKTSENKTIYSQQTSTNADFEVTGTVGTDHEDNICNVFDMASNCWEWSTETYNEETNPCVYRGGKYLETHGADHRDATNTASSQKYRGFRTVLYLMD